MSDPDGFVSGVESIVAAFGEHYWWTLHAGPSPGARTDRARPHPWLTRTDSAPRTRNACTILKTLAARALRLRRGSYAHAATPRLAIHATEGDQTISHGEAQPPGADCRGPTPQLAIGFVNEPLHYPGQPRCGAALPRSSFPGFTNPRLPSLRLTGGATGCGEHRHSATLKRPDARNMPPAILLSCLPPTSGSSSG